MKGLRQHITGPVHIAPLVTFRIIFGGMMLASIIRFVAKGWVSQLYIEPTFYFTYFGFSWVKPLGDPGMYVVFGLMAIAAAFIMFGLFYRWASAVFFLLFTYVELIDVTTYLNHYYFVSIISLLLIFVPANCFFSLDAMRKPEIRCSHVPAWCVNIFKLQLGIVYFYAGLAKLHPDWLLEAQPLRLWLPARAHMPLIGPLFNKLWVAYFFSWFGALYDLSIPFLLLNRSSRIFAFMAVIAFHALTALLFPIGMFPYIMILSTLIFFSEKFHKNLIQRLKSAARIIFPSNTAPSSTAQNEVAKLYSSPAKRIILPLLYLHFAFQLLFPFRFAAYPGNLFWTEEGFRFSWRVMLMEKAGHITFYIKNPETGRRLEVYNSDFLNPLQEKMMATQPDMILQFAHFLADEYKRRGIPHPEVNADSFISLNGRSRKRFVDPNVDLVQIKDSFAPKSWLLPFEQPVLQAKK